MMSEENKDYVNFGDVCRGRLSQQCQYGSRYVNPRFNTESAREAGDWYPNLGEGLRITGKPSDYHSLKIHKDDVETFVERYTAYQKDVLEQNNSPYARRIKNN
jgi:hypothetical protein